MKRSLLLVIGLLVLLFGIFAFLRPQRLTNSASFEECVKNGNPVAESYPRTCRTKDGKVFTEVIASPPLTTSPSTTLRTSPSPTGVESTVSPSVSPDANIVVSDPKPNQKINTSYIVSGQARVFENTLEYRLKDAQGTILAEGYTTAQSPDIGQFGPFVITLRFDKPKTPNGTLQVFSLSAKDGSEINVVSIPVRF